MNNNLNNQQSLSTLFKEVQDIRYGRAKPVQKEIEREKVVKEKSYVSSRKFNAIGIIVGVLFIIMFFTTIHSNYIFAISEEEKVAIAEFEENQNPLNMMNIISSNISEYTKKEIITDDIGIDYETEYIDNNLLPKGEENLLQAGKFGELEKTIIKTYENSQLVDEKVISEITKSEPVKEIIERGTSQLLADKKAHIGDTLYTTDEIFMYKEDSEESETVCTIYQYIDVKLESVKDNWCYITVDGLEGYILGDYVTTEELTEGITEKSRIKRILLSLKEDMALNKPSGLTKDDFVKVLSNNTQDVNNIFSENAEYFYEAEQKYNVNGIFLASIGIHESNWGTSNIAMQKKNLFGYGSYDETPFESSYIFESYQYGIDLVAKVLSKYYLNEEGTHIYDNEVALGSYYNGPTVSGVNQRYATDTNWSNRVFSIMKSLYEKL